MKKDILILAGVLEESKGYLNRLPIIAGKYEALTIIVRNRLESYLERLDDPRWSKEESSKTMLNFLEKGVRETLELIYRDEKEIKQML